MLTIYQYFEQLEHNSSCKPKAVMWKMILTSWGWKARSSKKTCRISSSLNRGTLTTTVKAFAMPRCFMTSASLLVPITISFLPFGGCFSRSSRMICSRLLEKRGPIGTYSTNRSMLSSITSEAGDYSAENEWILNSGYGHFLMQDSWFRCLKLLPVYGNDDALRIAGFNFSNGHVLWQFARYFIVLVGQRDRKDKKHSHFCQA